MVELWTVLVILFVLVLLLPVLGQAVRRSRRIRTIREIERKRGTRVITLIHRQERMTFLGIPFFRYIDITDSEEILRAIRLTPPTMPIDLVVHTPGGLVLSAEQIAMALKRHPGHVTVFVPHYAMSGGTLLCLAAPAVVMDENAVLGPVDPIIGKYPAASVLKAVREKAAKYVDDETLILADIARKAQDQIRDFVRAMLVDVMDAETVERIVTTLTEGRWTHDYPITFHEAEAIGLPVSSGIPDEIYRLMELFPQAMPRRPSVEYIPVPYREGGREGGKK
jgi:ClpP class serine protease